MKEFYRNVKTKLIWRGGYETPAGKRVQGRPHRRKPRRLPDRPRKASAWSEINVQIVQAKKTIGKPIFIEFAYSLKHNSKYGLGFFTEKLFKTLKKIVLKLINNGELSIPKELAFLLFFFLYNKRGSFLLVSENGFEHKKTPLV
ncbi:hypothetical protein SRABI133_00610 [Peribacillus simplex]|uniref:Uncharacterized protein n=1 Tax=Peribacillus simplex TaxID=1478 RepID=A0A9W4PBC0_9BACI|nr:hypothetical protein SRABI133_00610 [Peribacillus simplex]